LKIKSCRFVRSAVAPKDEPREHGPDVVFLGRSNVGKSSLINRLLGTRGLAKTSSRPGKTRAINFYRINDAFHFVDLPGYGYARVSKAERASWGPMVESFLDRRRERIALAVLLVDARHEPTEHDRMMWQWLRWRELRHVVVATKADKLSGNGRAAAQRTLAATFGSDSGNETPHFLASAESGLGIPLLWRHLDEALG
jgi:GTP-binding protein